MSSSLSVSENDVCALAAIVTAEREDLPPHGLPPSLLADLIADFYSARQWRSSGMYADFYGPQGIEHQLQLCLPEPPGPSRGPGRTVRLYFFRFTGPDFSERDRALLTLIRPHLNQAFLDAERRRASVAPLTPRQTGLLRLVADGHTNTAIARRIG